MFAIRFRPSQRTRRPARAPSRPRLVERLEPRTLLAAALPAGFTESVWASGFNTPTAQAFAPDGRLFVLEKAGNVRVVTADGTLRLGRFTPPGGERLATQCAAFRSDLRLYDAARALAR